MRTETIPMALSAYSRDELRGELLRRKIAAAEIAIDTATEDIRRMQIHQRERHAELDATIARIKAARQ
jgi:hypothetical protein